MILFIAILFKFQKVSKAVFYDFVFLHSILGEVKDNIPENLLEIDAVDGSKSNTSSLADTIIETNSNWAKSDGETDDSKEDSDPTK